MNTDGVSEFRLSYSMIMGNRIWQRKEEKRKDI